jgi:hypothetical protein
MTIDPTPVDHHPVTDDGFGGAYPHRTGLAHPARVHAAPVRTALVAGARLETILA